MSFGDDPDRTALPSTPPEAAVGAGQCPSCDSQGWFAESPVCKFSGGRQREMDSATESWQLSGYLDQA